MDVMDEINMYWTLNNDFNTIQIKIDTTIWLKLN